MPQHLITHTLTATTAIAPLFIFTSTAHAASQPTDDIQLSTDYINNLQHASDNDANTHSFAKIANPLFDQNVYQSDPTAQQETIDPSNLTPDQQIKINTYSTTLINEIRQANHIAPLQVNTDAIQMETEIANYTAQNNIHGHYLGKYNQSGENVGGHWIVQPEYQEKYHAVPYHEIKPADFDIQYSPVTNATCFQLKRSVVVKTMDDLQAMVYYGITNMLFYDEGIERWGHSNNFLYWSTQNKYMPLGIQYIKHHDNDFAELYLRWLLPFGNNVNINPAHDLPLTVIVHTQFKLGSSFSQKEQSKNQAEKKATSIRIVLPTTHKTAYKTKTAKTVDRPVHLKQSTIKLINNRTQTAPEESELPQTSNQDNYSAIALGAMIGIATLGCAPIRRQPR